MIRATTPLHEFIFDSDPSAYTRILITYKQNDAIVLEKTKEDLTIETEGTKWIASLRLSQEETKRFRAGTGKPVQVQVRVLTESGEALASEKENISVQDVLNDEVLE